MLDQVLFRWLAPLGLFITFFLLTPTANYDVAQGSVLPDPRLSKCDHSALDVDNRSLKGPVRAVLLESSSLTWNGTGWDRSPKKLIESRAYHPSGLLVEHVGYDTNVPFEAINSAIYSFKNIALPDDKGRLIAEKHMSKDSFQTQSVYQYDESNNLRKAKHESNFMAPIESSYTYNSSGDLTEVTEISLGAKSPLSTRVYSYNYNKNGQLISCLRQTKSVLPPTSQQLELFFDHKGNVIEVTEQLSDDDAYRKHISYDENGRALREVYVSLTSKRQSLSSGAEIIWNTEGIVYTEDMSYDQTDLYGNWTIKRTILTQGSAAETMSGRITIGLKGVSREEYRTLTYY